MTTADDEFSSAFAPPRSGRRSADPAPMLRPRRVPSPLPPTPAEADVQRYYLCCEEPSGDFVEVIVAVSDAGRRRYFATTDGASFAEVDDDAFARRSEDGDRSLLELDAREIDELEAELGFVRAVRGRDPLAELAAARAEPVESSDERADDVPIEPIRHRSNYDEVPGASAAAADSDDGLVALLPRDSGELGGFGAVGELGDAVIPAWLAEYVESTQTAPHATVEHDADEAGDMAGAGDPAGVGDDPAGDDALGDGSDDSAETDDTLETEDTVMDEFEAMVMGLTAPETPAAPAPAPAAAPTPAVFAAPADEPADEPAAEASIAVDGAAQVALAKGIAFVAHRGQLDRTGAEYIDHPGRVAEHFDAASEPVATAAAWLHDVLEDSAVTAQDLLEAGVVPEVVEAVVLLTRTDEVAEAEYYARIRGNETARRVKLADVADNAAPWRLRKLDFETQARLAEKYRHAREALGA